MKLLFFAAASVTIIGGGAIHYAQASIDKPSVEDVNTMHVESTPKIEMVYLPNNTCRIETHEQADVSPTVYKEYVKACLNNRNLRTIIEQVPSN